MTSRTQASPAAGKPPTLGPGFSMTLSRPRVSRWEAPQTIGRRVADFKRFFAFWIDIVEDADISTARDKNIHVKMMRDPQMYACFNIRAYATASLPWVVSPAGEDNQAREFAHKVTKMFKAMPNFPALIKNILLSVPMGLSIQEVVWWYNDNLEIIPWKLFPVHKDRFVFDLDGNLAIRSPVDVFWGEAVPEYTFIPHVSDQLPGSFYAPGEEARLFYGFGLNDVLYPTWLAKQILLRMDLRYLERFANPYRIGRYPRKNEQARAAVQSLVDDLSNDQVLLFPSDEGYDIEVSEVGQGGHASFQTILDYCDRQISKVYLGSTLLLDIGDVGSYSLGRVHERTTFGRIAEYDHNAVAGFFNNFLIPWIFELNSWPMKARPKFEFTMKESQDASEMIEALRVLQSMGFPVSAEMITEQTGFRQAEEGESILEMGMDEEGNPQVGGALATSTGRQQLLSGIGNEGFTMDRKKVMDQLNDLEMKVLGIQLDKMKRSTNG
jgi:phage gp29-like protein